MKAEILIGTTAPTSLCGGLAGAAGLQYCALKSDVNGVSSLPFGEKAEG
jgi:hypothetical protein